MQDYELNVSKDTRQRTPYRSLLAELLFQGVRDAIADVMAEEDSGDRPTWTYSPRSPSRTACRL